MKNRKMLTFVACAVGLAQFVQAQNAPAAEASTLNPDEFAAITATTGSIIFKYTITVSSAIPKNGLVTCEGEASVNESGVSFTSIREYAARPHRFIFCANSAKGWGQSRQIHPHWRRVQHLETALTRIRT